MPSWPPRFAEFADKWSALHPEIVTLWRSACLHIVPSFDYDMEIHQQCSPAGGRGADGEELGEKADVEDPVLRVEQVPDQPGPQPVARVRIEDGRPVPAVVVAMPACGQRPPESAQADRDEVEGADDPDDVVGQVRGQQANQGVLVTRATSRGKPSTTRTRWPRASSSSTVDGWPT